MERTENPVVQTKAGKLRGTYEDGLFVFRGVPYAVPPVGKLRWMPPTPLESWDGVRPAEKFGPTSIQQVMQMSFTGREPENEPQSEDCLYLNIWSPGLDDQKRAVMVWIHGGGYTMGSGSSSMHPGDVLPKRGDVVMVTINYRLGVLGFLNLKEVTGGKIPATGNEGLLDQVAAVRWVRDNIAAFGGDPDNITVFGESAGAMSIGGLLAMPAAKGLFHKAILQSGANTVRPLDEAVKVTNLFLKEFGISATDTDALMSLTPEAILKGQQAFPLGIQRNGIKGAPSQPVVEGDVLPDYPLDAIADGSARGVITLSGSNLDEMKIFQMTRPGSTNPDESEIATRLASLLPSEYIPGLISAYREARSNRGMDASPNEILIAIQTDLQFRMPGVRVAEAQSALKQPAYNYLFTWESAIPGMGACHALDVGFVFGNMSKEFHGTGPEADELSGIIQDAWLAFAKTGNPSCPSSGEWPEYGDDRRTMMLGRKCYVAEAPYEEEKRAWNSIPNMYLR
ncbi:MAG: carboxylesterase/lipase family protein [Dehalococcoidales bacterium]|nr:MAG: carboxylesterase/lipase family protein [Dehalococcoidales bacterium]